MKECSKPTRALSTNKSASKTHTQKTVAAPSQEGKAPSATANTASEQENRDFSQPSLSIRAAPPAHSSDVPPLQDSHLKPSQQTRGAQRQAPSSSPSRKSPRA